MHIQNQNTALCLKIPSSKAGLFLRNCIELGKSVLSQHLPGLRTDVLVFINISFLSVIKVLPRIVKKFLVV